MQEAADSVTPMTEDTEQAQMEYHKEVHDSDNGMSISHNNEGTSLAIDNKLNCKHDTNSLLQQAERDVTDITKGQHTIEPAPRMRKDYPTGVHTKKLSQRKMIGVHARAMIAKRTLSSVADDLKTIVIQEQKMIIFRKWEDEAAVDQNILEAEKLDDEEG